MTPRKAVALFISKEIEHQTGLMQQALGELTLRANRIEALSKVLLLYQPRETAAPTLTMASIASAVAEPKDASIDGQIEHAVEITTPDSFELSGGGRESDVTPVASLSPTVEIPEPATATGDLREAAGGDVAPAMNGEPAASFSTEIPGPGYGHHSEAAGGDVTPALEGQSEPAADAAPLREGPIEDIIRADKRWVDEHRTQLRPAADVEALEPEQPARKSVKRVVMPKNKLNPAGILETKEEQKPAVLAKAEPLFDRVMNLWAETDLDFKTIARNAECSVEMISAFVAKARKHNDPRGFARTERGKAPVFKKPIEISRADGAPISGASKPPAKKPIVEDTNPVSHHLSEDELRMLGLSNGVVVLDFPNRKVIGHRGTFTSPVETMRVLEKLNSGDLLPIALLAKAGGYSSEDVFKMTLPRLAEKLSDVGVIMTNLKGFGVRITRSASV